MKITFFCLLLMACLPSLVLASEQQLITTSRSAVDYDEIADRLNLQTQEMQNLLARIEVLEHKIDQLNQQILCQGKQNTSKSLPPATSRGQIKANTDNEDDIFSAPLKTLKSSPSSSSGEQNIATPLKVEVVEAQDKKLYNAALAALKNNKLKIAEEKLNEFITNYPQSSLQSNAYFWHGETFFRRNMFNQAAISYLKGYKQFPKGAKAADSLLKLALSLGELKKKVEACSVLNKLDVLFPNRPAAAIKRAADAKAKFGCQ